MNGSNVLLTFAIAGGRSRKSAVEPATAPNVERSA